MNRNELGELFQQKFGHDRYRLFFAPGRINLIGEHTDYNGGHVFPCAITFGTYVLARKRDDQRIRLYSVNFPEEGVIEFPLTDSQYNRDHSWANFPKGMIHFLRESGYEIETGVDMLVYGNIPNGAGLSSSASIELVTGVVLEGLFNLEIDRVALVKIGQKVENQFIGVNSGIMDQFAIGMGKRGYGMLLDCQTLSFEYAPINLKEYQIIIMNTNKRRELADSKYNERKSECELALKELQAELQISSLGELTEELFEQKRKLISDQVIQKRAKHVVYENSRTIRALKELKNGHIENFGELMNESHRSLRDDYEVTGIELDTLVEAAWQQEGVIGARMTGAGFGGCAIAIVETKQTSVFINQVGSFYKEKIGYEATFYVAQIGDGAREITEEEMQ